MNNVKSLENAFKFLMRSGLPYGSAEDFLEATIEYRMIFDVTFFLSVQIMLNIIKGNYCNLSNHVLNDIAIELAKLMMF